MLPTRVDVEKSMLLIPVFSVLLAIRTAALACVSSTEPGLDWMIKDSTLIVRGEVLRESGDNQWIQGEKRHASNVLFERAYKETASNIIRASWKEFATCPPCPLNMKQLCLSFL